MSPNLIFARECFAARLLVHINISFLYCSVVFLLGVSATRSLFVSFFTIRDPLCGASWQKKEIGVENESLSSGSG